MSENGTLTLASITPDVNFNALEHFRTSAVFEYRGGLNEYASRRTLSCFKFNHILILLRRLRRLLVEIFLACQTRTRLGRLLSSTIAIVEEKDIKNDYRLPAA